MGIAKKERTSTSTQLQVIHLDSAIISAVGILVAAVGLASRWTDVTTLVLLACVLLVAGALLGYSWKSGNRSRVPDSASRFTYLGTLGLVLVLILFGGAFPDTFLLPAGFVLPGVIVLFIGIIRPRILATHSWMRYYALTCLTIAFIALAVADFSIDLLNLVMHAAFP